MSAGVSSQPKPPNLLVPLPLWRPTGICREGYEGKNLKMFRKCHLLFFLRRHFPLCRCFGAFQVGSLSWWSTSPITFKTNFDLPPSPPLTFKDNFDQSVTGHSGERAVRWHLGGKGSDRTLGGKGSERTHLSHPGIFRIDSIFTRWLLLVKTIYICEQVIKINRTPIFILNLLIPYCYSASWYLESGQHHLLLVDTAGSHLAFRYAFLNQFILRHFQCKIWSVNEIIFPGHCIFTIFSGSESCYLWHRSLYSPHFQNYNWISLRWFPFVKKEKNPPLLFLSSLVPYQLRVGSFQPQTSPRQVSWNQCNFIWIHLFPDQDNWSSKKDEVH